MAEHSDNPRANRLHEVRFAPSRESLVAMRHLKQSLPELQKDFPELKGFGFFGSRVLGTEDPAKSDLDTAVFYNSDDLPEGQTAPTVPLSTLKNPKTSRLQTLGTAIKKKLAADHLENSTLVAIDISPEITRAFLAAFIEALDEGELEHRPIPLANRNDRTAAFVAYLFSRFYLATGEEVYRNRKLILDYFERLPKGDHYFKALMNHLAYGERFRFPETGRPPLPQTIAEAREYFLTK